MKEVVILVPTLGRADVLEGLVSNIADTTPEGIWRILFVVDEEDAPTIEVVSDMLRRRLGEVAMMVSNGRYPEKINAGAAATNEPWLVITADDVKFHPGWWENAMMAWEADWRTRTPAFQEEGRDLRLPAGVIGTNDLHQPDVLAGKYATQFIVNRRYIEELGGPWGEPGKVFHEGYHHNCIDVELSEVAKARGLWLMVFNSFIEHLHPCWGKNEVDDTYRKGSLANVHEDLRLLDERRKMWTGT